LFDSARPGAGVDHEPRTIFDHGHVVVIQVPGAADPDHDRVVGLVGRALGEEGHMDVEDIVVAVAVIVHEAGELPAAGIRGAGEALVDRTVAVIIDVIVDLDIGGAHGRTGVVAVSRVRDVARGSGTGGRGRGAHAIAVAVAVAVVRVDHALVRGSVAIVIRVVAGLGRARVDASAHIIAVGRVGDVPARCGAGRDRGGRHAVAVAVAVAVVGHGHALIHDAVAVVVLAVAGLGGARVDAVVGVIAVAAVLGVAVAIVVRGTAGAALVGIAIAVVVDAVIAALSRARVGRGGAVVAVIIVCDVARGLAARGLGGGHVAIGVGIGVGVEGGGDALVHAAITVVIDAVADLGVGGAHGCAHVIAVVIVCDVARGGRGRGDGRGHGAVAVPVAVAVAVVGVGAVGAALVHFAVAVIVIAVALLGGTRVHIVVVIVAVLGSRAAVLVRVGLVLVEEVVEVVGIDLGALLEAIFDVGVLDLDASVVVDDAAGVSGGAVEDESWVAARGEDESSEKKGTHGVFLLGVVGTRSVTHASVRVWCGWAGIEPCPYG